MSIIEQAARRLEELQRAGVDVPWAAAGIDPAELRSLVGLAHAPAQQPAQEDAAPVAAPATESVPERRSRAVEIDLDGLAAAGYLVSAESRSALADEFRAIKRPLIRNINGEGAAPVHRANLVLVTSALPGEGKTFCALNLALSIALEVDKTVLLVDADVIRPAVMQRIGVAAERGLMDVLEDPQLELADVLLRTNVPKLTVLPAGRPSARSTELLASDAMERLLEELATKYNDRIIVFDAPPILPTTESRVLASRAGQIVVVVESDQTHEADVKQAFAALEACPVVMSVLNKCRGAVSRYRYGYYGG